MVEGMLHSSVLQVSDAAQHGAVNNQHDFRDMTENCACQQSTMVVWRYRLELQLMIEARRDEASEWGLRISDYAISHLTGRALENSHAGNKFWRNKLVLCFLINNRTGVTTYGDRLFTCDVMLIHPKRACSLFSVLIRPCQARETGRDTKRHDDGL
ncbi:hypothetical protein GQ44DRAFT_328911 [Phaeosphaeriaceae sp. PMI808]|nr:hypothetical protein GQ44DRAFT_328911 [Phaeosphaeriaceae sp. PMI808]